MIWRSFEGADGSGTQLSFFFTEREFGAERNSEKRPKLKNWLAFHLVISLPLPNSWGLLLLHTRSPMHVLEDNLDDVGLMSTW